MIHSFKKVLLLGSGGLKISQAGEFDYSGSQAIKALQEEKIEVVLVNPNIATVQTDANMADKVYLQPLNKRTVTQIIKQEKPDAILLSFGGQTALNLGLELEADGILSTHNVKVLGTSVDTIRLAEDRALFKAELEKIKVDTAKSFCVTTVKEALIASDELGFPLMIRSGFSLGGLGSGIIQNKTMLEEVARATLSVAPQILVEECLLGWHEYEYEIVRDQAGNTITVCNMENLDPMGVHTGESIVVAPSQTLDNHDYHFLREIAIKVANHFKIVGECNIQYAFNSKNGEYRVIEINPRLSRSSALASKATGYPLAYVAAKLALGFKLYELKNSVTQQTCAFFEPALDYIVVKLPRWDIHKLREADRRIGTEMKSVGEVMAIGRSFPEALQKAVGMLNIGLRDLADFQDKTLGDHLKEITYPTDRRLFVLYDYFRHGATVEAVKAATQINDWFLKHIHHIAQFELSLKKESSPTPALIKQAKKLGFSDASLGRLFKQSENAIREFRLSHQIIPYVKQIDTLAGEFAAKSNYLYLSYHAQAHDILPADKPLVLVLGSGPYSIGSSVEFDWCAVNTVRTLRSLGYTTALINSNPETVSTDYDESDRLYFEQLSLERVSDIASFENLAGIIISVGGQIANNLALPLAKAGLPILGTNPKDIDTAENRQLFSSKLNELHIDQPAWISANCLESIKHFVDTVQYPVLIRPSYVLSGAAMNVVYNEKELLAYLGSATDISREHPVVISKFVDNAKELEIDGIAKYGEIVIQAISEHIENAGVHSGDATVVLPPQQLYLETIRRTKQIARKIVKALNIHGPFNMQFLAKDNAIQVIECNVRASRSFPFVSKVCNHNLIEIMTKVLMNKPVAREYETLELDYVGVKTPQFSYRRLKGANPVAHVEMASTGEVACLGDDLMEAFFRSWLSTEQSIARKHLFVSVGSMGNKHKLLPALKALDAAGWELFATYGTHDFLSKNGVGSICLFKILEGKTPNVKDYIMEKRFDLIINIPNGNKSLGEQFTDGYHVRRLAIEHQIPLITNLQLAQLMLKCLSHLNDRKLSIKSWQDFMAHRQVSAELNFFDLQ